jgi:hypothetical protein
MADNKREPEALEEFIERINSTNLRFAVGNSSCGFSSVWTAFGNRSDYYIGARPAMGSTKISLHASGICRVALTDKQFNALEAEGLTQPPDRAMIKWRRAKTPETGAVHIASVIFPTDYLSITEEPRGTHKKPLLIFEAAPPGQAVEFGFFYSYEDEVSMEKRYARIGQSIVCTTLDNGERVTILVRITEFDRACLPSQDQADKAPGLILSKDVFNTERELSNLTATFWNDPKDGETLRLVEIGGMKLRRK